MSEPYQVRYLTSHLSVLLLTPISVHSTMFGVKYSQSLEECIIIQAVHILPPIFSFRLPRGPAAARLSIAGPSNVQGLYRGCYW